LLNRGKVSSNTMRYFNIASNITNKLVIKAHKKSRSV
jgi:hypothetical protein